MKQKCNKKSIGSHLLQKQPFSFECWKIGKTLLVGFLSFSPCADHDLTFTFTFTGRTTVQAKPCRVGFAASVSTLCFSDDSLNQQCLLVFIERKQKRFGHSRKTQPCLNFSIIDCLAGFLDFASSCGDATFCRRRSVSNSGPGPEPSWQGSFHSWPQLLAATVCQTCTAVGRKSQKWVTSRVGLVQVIHSLMKSLPMSCCLWDMGGNIACA